MTSAASQGLAACHDCGRLTELDHGHGSCPRCGSALHFRRKNALSRTWALLFAAAVMYVPANVLPVSTKFEWLSITALAPAAELFPMKRILLGSTSGKSPMLMQLVTSNELPNPPAM